MQFKITASSFHRGSTESLHLDKHMSQLKLYYLFKIDFWHLFF